jgi:PAS domain S-box-containing protein
MNLVSSSLSAVSQRILGMPWIARYLIAAGAVSGGIAARVTLESAWGRRYPYITFFLAVVLSAWAGGIGPGIFATLVSAASVAYLWLEPTGSPLVRDSWDVLGLGIFVVVGLLMSVLNEAWRRQTLGLLASEQRLEVMLGSIADAVIATDQHGVVRRMNKVAETLTGWSVSEAVGRSVREVFVIVNEQSRQAVENPVDAALKERRITGLPNNTLLLSRHGGEVLIDDSVAPIFAEDGSLSGAIMVFRDVSERPRLERLAREMSAIVESSDDAIVSKSLEGVIRSWNAGAERIFGYTAAEAVGQSIRLIIPKARWSEEDEVLRRLRAGEKVDHFETVRRRKDGSEIAISLTVSPIRSSNGDVIGASKIARDISERRLAERERAGLLLRERRAYAEAARASRMKDEFLAVLSHELRTPLNAVLGYAHLLKAGLMPPDQIPMALAAIERNARAQARLVESLLDLSRVLAGKLDLNVEGLDLATVIDATLDVFRPEAAAKDISLEAVVPKRPIAIVADNTRLQQVFWNLLANALKFTPAGGHVRISLTADDQEVRVQVADNGQGIPPEFLPHVFDRFVQRDRDRRGSAAGLGLGLSLVRELVQAHGGSVQVESAGQGCGTTFTVTLPLVAPARTVGQSSEATETAGAETQNLTGLDVVVVDDASDARDLLAVMLTTRGARVRVASSGPEGLQMIAERHPDVMLADIEMPEMDGYSLVRALREREREQNTARVPAIAVTAYASPREREQAMDAGFDGHVPKPVDPTALVRAVVSIVPAANA